MRLALGVYTVLGALLAPVGLVVLAMVRRARLPLHQRLGGGRPGGAATTTRLLFHAASAGDVRAVVPIIKALSALRPGWEVVVTVQTRSGMQTATRLLPKALVRALPIDAWPWMDRFIHRVSPRVVVLEYLEVWPRMLLAARRRDARVALVNGRLHPRRRPRYGGPLGGWLRALLRGFELVTARSDDDARALAALGVGGVTHHVHTKHALLAAPHPEALRELAERRGLGALQRDNTWVAGSLHRDEVAVTLEAHTHVLRARPNARLLVCPRYPTEGQYVAERAEALGLRWGQVGDAPGLRQALAVGDHDDLPQVVVVASVGELATLYGLGSVALVGGTLGVRGGQNPLEPAAAGATIIVGPATQQIEPELELLGSGPARLREVRAETLAAAVLAAWEDPGRATPEGTCDELARAARRAAARLAAQLVALAERR